MSDTERYGNPLGERYASPEMNRIFSDRYKYSTWRRVWLALAEAEKEMGLPISDAQLEELRATLDDVNFESAEAHEKRLRHDVMAHLHA